MPIDDDKINTKHIIIFGFLFLLLLLLCFYDIFYNYRALTQQPLLAEGTPCIVFEVKPHTSARKFTKQLQALKLVRSSHVLLALIRWRGISNHLQAGIYQINSGETVIHLLNRVVKGDVLVEPFIILEGSTLAALKQSMIKAPYLVDGAADFSAIQGHYLSAEGLLLADTYYYKAGSNASTLLKQANQNLLNYLDLTWKNRNSTLPYKTPYELLVAASIIEKEASLPEERKIIAGVIINRLKLHMPLQMDPTVIYALGKDKVPLRHQDLQIDSPYNTYRYRGLPPTPIAMVGKESLDAAAHPAETHYLYFYAKGDGTHQFSKNYQEQQEAIRQFKPRVVTP
jgi:UPF0755 protein